MFCILLLLDRRKNENNEKMKNDKKWNITNEKKIPWKNIVGEESFDPLQEGFFSRHKCPVGVLWLVGLLICFILFLQIHPRAKPGFCWVYGVDESGSSPSHLK